MLETTTRANMALAALVANLATRGVWDVGGFGAPVALPGAAQIAPQSDSGQLMLRGNLTGRIEGMRNASITVTKAAQRHSEGAERVRELRGATSTVVPIAPVVPAPIAFVCHDDGENPREPVTYECEQS